jgi:uncharacterized protein (DUF433 family)
MLFCRLVWEQTVWTWERGPQMVGFSLAHGGGVSLFLFPIGLILWTVGVVIATIWNLFKKRQISLGRWFAIGAIVLLFVSGSLSEGFWERVFISRMARSTHAGDLMLYAAYRGDLPTVRDLVMHGVPADAKDHAYWRTALHGAASKGDVNIIRFLASSGANINAVDRSGDSPLELALANHQKAAGNVLTALGAKRIQGDQAQRDKAIRARRKGADPEMVVQELSDSFPAIDTRPDVCGGEPCIVRTRIPVWLLEQARRLGTSEQALLAAYPALRAEDLANAWAYVRSHVPEIEAQIRENEAA